MTQRLLRWSLFLSEFNFKIEYRSGSSNGNLDALSRRPDYALNEEFTTSDIPFSVLRTENFTANASFISSLNERILYECKYDEFYHNITNYLGSDFSQDAPSNIKYFKLRNSYLLYNDKIYVPSKCRSSVLSIYYDSPSAGHYGIKKTVTLIYRDF